MKKLIIGILIFIFVSIIFYLDLSRVSMNNLFIPNNDKKATKYLKEKNNMTEISIITKKEKK